MLKHVLLEKSSTWLKWVVIKGLWQSWMNERVLHYWWQSGVTAEDFLLNSYQYFIFLDFGNTGRLSVWLILWILFSTWEKIVVYTNSLLRFATLRTNFIWMVLVRGPKCGSCFSSLLSSVVYHRELRIIWFLTDKTSNLKETPWARRFVMCVLTFYRLADNEMLILCSPSQLFFPGTDKWRERA